MAFVEARRTTLAAGKEAEYERIHSEIPQEIAGALTRCGVLSWRIWRDERRLFHVVETEDGYPIMMARMAQLGPVNPAWDTLIEGLLNSEPGSDAMLSPVWFLSRSVQGLEQQA
jgi:L-rhamnose mutarotase